MKPSLSYGRFFIIIAILTISGNKGLAQAKDFYGSIDQIAIRIPETETQYTWQIADYFNSRFTAETDKVRAAFIWVAVNISYDVENMYTVNFYESTDEVVRNTLKERKGVCMGYAHLFQDIVAQMGIRSFVVDGYTRQNGYVDYVPHAWCAAYVDSAWHFFDPTWGSGYVRNMEFVPEINDDYFLVSPENMIKSHMPFDPLWQFLPYPLTYQEFSKGSPPPQNGRDYFNFSDSLEVYENQTEIDRLVAANARMDKNGAKNSLVFDRVQHNRQNIEYFRNNAAVDKYNSAVLSYNEGINHLNSFITYRNNQFTPKKPDEEILGMVSDAETSLNDARQKLASIETQGRELAAATAQLYLSIEEAMVNLREQQAFLEKYYSTGKAFRKSLFYRYTWMGIPIK